MTKLFLAMISLFSLSALASVNVYDLQIELAMNGQHALSPRVVTPEGEAAMLTLKTEGEGSFIEVVASEGEIQGSKGILMKFVVGVIDEDGQRTILSKPQLLAQENEKAEITIYEDDDKEILSLSVIAQRK